MKIKTLCCLLLFIVILLSSCSSAPAQPAQPDPTLKPEGVISIYAEPEVMKPIINKFLELHPDFRYSFTTPFIQHIAYTPLDAALDGTNSESPDIYFVGSTAGTTDMTMYTQGEMSQYAMPYDALDIDTAAETQKAGIFNYIIDTGTRPGDNAVVGLSYDSRACAFIYRRSLAKKVWGTDDPAVVKTKIGPGWEKYLETETELWDNGYVIDCMDCDLLSAVKSCGKGYLSNQIIDAYDLHKEVDGMTYFGCLGSARMLSYLIKCSSENEDIYGAFDVSGSEGDWAVCAPPENFFGSGSWVLVNKNIVNEKKKAAIAEFVYWMTLDCTENGLQYYYANGLLDYGSGPSGVKNTVASRAVMEKADGTMSFFGGQDIFDVFIPASQNIDGASYGEDWLKQQY